MPSASEELRDRMVERFGNIDDGPVTAHLRERGYVLDKTFHWRLPEGQSIQDIPAEDYECLVFLCQEWDHAVYNPR